MQTAGEWYKNELQGCGLVAVRLIANMPLKRRRYGLCESHSRHLAFSSVKSSTFILTSQNRVGCGLLKFQ